MLAGAALLLSSALTPRGTIENDVGYYHAWVELADRYGFSQILPEYPTPVMLLLWLPTLVAPTQDAYRILFVAASLAGLAAGAAMMTRLPGARARQTAPVVFLACTGALGPITLYRFDLLPGVLLAAACVALAREEAASGSRRRGRDRRPWWSVLVALGTGIKAWPIIVWPLVLGERSRRRREAAGFIATGAVLVAVSVAAAGWGRLFSPLTWQSGRGLQVESVLATWVLLARLVSPSSWTAALSDANSWDFSGPGVSATLALGTAAQVVLLVWIAAVCWRLWRTRAAEALAVAVSATSVVAVLVATDKVFSPQYMMWLAPVAAVACGIGRARVPRWWAPVLVAICALTQLSYPTTYGWLYPGDGGALFLVGTLLMVARNAMVAVFAVSACRTAWRLTARVGSAPAGPVPTVSVPLAEGGAALDVPARRNPPMTPIPSRRKADE